MSYCINPWCGDRKHSDSSNPSELLSAETRCRTCGTLLLVQGRYRLIRPLRELDEWEPSEVFEIEDVGQLGEAGERGDGELADGELADGEFENTGAIKVLKVLKKASFQPQFEREIKTLQHLRHSGIPRVAAGSDFSLSVAESRTLHCLVMEKIPGLNLDSWLQENGPIQQERAIDWMGQLVDVLGQLHKEHLFHRDIKLSNIMLRSTGELALIDFGTVRPMSGTYFAKISGQRDITSVVSPGYTPLEQINGKAVPQSDFYALGRSFVYLLTGQHPIDLPEDEATGRLEWRDRTQFPLDDWLAQLLDDMMAPFLAQRPLNAEAITARLHQAQMPSIPLAPAVTQPNDETDNERAVTKAVESKIEDFKRKQQMWFLVVANVGLLVLHCVIGMNWLNVRSWRSPGDESGRASNLSPSSLPSTSPSTEKQQ